MVVVGVVVMAVDSRGIQLQHTTTTEHYRTQQNTTLRLMNYYTTSTVDYHDYRTTYTTTIGKCKRDETGKSELPFRR